ncbi:hypothetical protein GCM10027299_37090 [Larkinella ripae]
MFGPYSTEIKTTRDTWDILHIPARKKPNRPLDDGTMVYDPSLDFHRKLKLQIEQYEREFENAQLRLVREKRPLTAPVIHGLTLLLCAQDTELSLLRHMGEQAEEFRRAAAMWEKTTQDYLDEKSAGKDKTLKEVYEEFITFRKSLVNDNQYTRTEDQVSQNTYDANIASWNRIYQFLQFRREEKLLVKDLRRSFFSEFKEWLLKQPVPHFGTRYKSSTIHKTQGFLGMLCEYAIDKEYIATNPAPAGRKKIGQKPKPKPLSVEMLDYLETVELPEHFRFPLDCWLIAGELCLHYADYMNLPVMKIHTFESGIRYIHHPRKKQHGIDLMITADITPRAERLLAKYAGVNGLIYRSANYFSTVLKSVSKLLKLKKDDGTPLRLQFGMGRDSGMTNRAKEGASPEVLKNSGAHSNVSTQAKYIADAPGVLEEHLKRKRLQGQTPGKDAA